MNIIEGLHNEMDRVRGIIIEYDSLPKNAGAFAAMMMRYTLKQAESAIAVGDTVTMIAILKELQGYEL